MAAFSNIYHQDNNMMNNPFVLDHSVFLQNHQYPMNNKLNFMEDGNNNMIMMMMMMNNNNTTTNCFPQFYPPEVEETETHVDHHDHSHSHSSKVALSGGDDNEPSSVTTRKQSSESSTVVDRLDESGEQVTQKLNKYPIDNKKRRTRNIGSSSPNSAKSKDGSRGKKQKQCNGEAKEQQPKAAHDNKKDQKKDQEPPSGYIHVRARRGQATDSHSLAERVRREKISERMKTLQRLVPGCDKVTGKALMLDEIINYVQSLQNQVEFLSLKLASVNPMFYDFGMDQDAFIFRPSERASPVPQCSPNQQPTVFADTTATSTTTTTTTSTTTTPNNINYPLLDSSASINLLHHQQGHRSDNAFSQDNGSLLWDLDMQGGQKFLNPSGFSDNLCSFN